MIKKGILLLWAPRTPMMWRRHHEQRYVETAKAGGLGNGVANLVEGAGRWSIFNNFMWSCAAKKTQNSDTASGSPP